MNEKVNCWEYLNCKYQKELNEGGCPAYTDLQYHGINRGKNGGRICWAIDGTQCQADPELQICGCLECDFFQQVKMEEGDDFILTI